MKPQTPEELYDDGEDLADEGMLFIGDRGKILCDFRGNTPRLIPSSRQQAFEGSIAGARTWITPTPDDEWMNAIRNGTKSRGSFEAGGAAGRSRDAGGIALRVPYKRLLLGRREAQFTNSPEANAFVRREHTGRAGSRCSHD